jgi:hypothetical protein
VQQIDLMTLMKQLGEDLPNDFTFLYQMLQAGDSS